MISIDGSYGEGGGQILRTAVTLSVLTKTPISINNIRANRPNPGIKPQHFTALSIMKKLSNATTEGLEIGSSSLSFTPGTFIEGTYRFDVGTAGSLPLICQTIFALALHISKPLEISLTGGTDVKWSPSWDYLNFVFLHVLQQCGIHIDAKLLKRGYYPKGGGEILLKINPCEDLQGIIFDTQTAYKTVNGRIHLGNLPEHIGTRMKHQVIKLLMKEKLSANVSVDIQSTLSSGAGITLWSINNNGTIGCCILGEKGIPAEKIAELAVSNILKNIMTGASFDEHLFDQILLYLMLARKRSVCFIRTINNHAKTTIWLIKKFYPKKDLIITKISKDLLRVEIK